MSRLSRPLYSRLLVAGNGLVLGAALLAGGPAAAAGPDTPRTGAPRPAAHVRAATVAPVTVVRPALTRPAARGPVMRTARVVAPPATARRVSGRRAPLRATTAAGRPRTATVRTSASSWSATFAASIARIPGYPPGSAQWVVSDAYGSWGTTDWYQGTIYISPRVPQDRLYDVVSHEWSHLLSVAAYGGDVQAATAAMNRWFGGSGLTGAERAADCMARQLGARWTHYTNCQDGRWRAGAARLVQKEQL